MLDEIIDDRIFWAKKEMAKSMNFILPYDTCLASDTIILNEELYFKYEFTPYNVNSFRSIGWDDPLPEPMRQKSKPETLEFS